MVSSCGVKQGSKYNQQRRKKEVGSIPVIIENDL
jgi:hypothetical protein